RFFLTFSSCPEYAWITYHWASADADATSALSVAINLPCVSRIDEAPQQLAQPEVHRGDEQGDHAHRHDHHQGEAVELLRSRPDDLAQLLEGLAQKADDPGGLVGLGAPAGRDRHVLPRLSMRRVLAAPAAVLLELQTIRIVLLVLDRVVVAAFALGALERDDRFHRSISLAGEGMREPSEPRLDQ